MSNVLAPELWPFTLAIGLLLVLVLLEGVALLIGASLLHWLGVDSGEPDGTVAAVLGWLHIGKVPLLVLVIIFLTVFGCVGFAEQLIAKDVTGHLISPIIPAAVAAIAALGAMRILGAALGKVIPKDESSAISDASLVGRVGTIVIGVAQSGRPAQARILDQYGTPHYVMVEPEGPDDKFAAGASVLLVRHVKSRHFQAIHNPKPGLL